MCVCALCACRCLDSEINPFIQSLPLILHHKEKVFSILMRHVSLPNSMSRKGLTDLIAVLARDLRSEFYPFFEQVVSYMLLMCPIPFGLSRLSLF